LPVADLADVVSFRDISKVMTAVAAAIVVAVAGLVLRRRVICRG
jgi:hypothetical protein